MYGIPLIFATGIVVSLATPAGHGQSAAGRRDDGGQA
jgi:hypothetical protein